MKSSESFNHIHRTSYGDNFRHLKQKNLVIYFVFKGDKKECISVSLDSGLQQVLFEGKKSMCDLVVSESEDYLAFNDGDNLIIFSFLTASLLYFSRNLYPIQFIKNDSNILCIEIAGRISKLVKCDLHDECYEVLLKFEGYIADPTGRIIYKGLSTSSNIVFFEKQNVLAIIVNEYSYNKALLNIYKLEESINQNIYIRKLEHSFVTIPKIIRFSGNSAIYSCADTEGFYLKKINIEDMTEKCIASEKGEIRYFSSGSEESIIFEVVDQYTSSTYIKELNVNTKEICLLVDQEGVNVPISFIEGSSDILYIHSSYKEPGDLWRYNRGRKQGVQVTKSTPYYISNSIPNISMKVVCLETGLNIKIYEPNRILDKLPVLIWLHGGPNIYSLNDFVPFEKWLASLGYLVCVPSYSGTLGYGIKNSLNVTGEGLGKNDVQDVLETIEYCKGLEVANEQQIAVVGVSYGGYLALRTAAMYSGLRAVFAYGAITDWYLQQTLTDVRNYDYWLLGDWVYNLDVSSISPIYEISKIEIPVFLTHGKQDINVPFEQVKRYVEKANALDKSNIMYYFYGDEGHGLPAYKKNNYNHWHRLLVDFLGFYLKDWNYQTVPYKNQTFFGGIEYENGFNSMVFKSKR